MLVVLADDFSGAAEIGGIAHRYGLAAEIQLSLNINSAADVIVMDTDTRALTQSDAIRKISDIAASIKGFGKAFHLFKKVDSVMRGHLVAEVNALLRTLHFNRVLMLPANPGRGRIIRSGKYFVNGKPLHETVFSSDPDFPATSEDVAMKIIQSRPDFPHLHIAPGDALPNGMFITGDIQSKEDLKKYVFTTNENDLCCGAAELFEAYLERLGYIPQIKNATQSPASDTSFTLIVNGSTIKNAEEIDLLKRSGITTLSLPGKIDGAQLLFPENEALVWRKSVVDTLTLKKVAVVVIEHSIHHSKTMSENFLKQFVQLIEYIAVHLDTSKVHFCLTGGATASSIIRHLEKGKLFVKEEITPGVVTLAMKTNKGEVYFTIKPGSYAWPVSIMQNLQSGKE